MDDRLFDLDVIPEVPLFREPKQRRGPARGTSLDARFTHDYPPEWDRCPECDGRGHQNSFPDGDPFACPACLGMGSLKARVRLEAGHRCARCGHPYIPKGDANLLARMALRGEYDGPTVASPGHWSRCDERCIHAGPVRYRFGAEDWLDYGTIAEVTGWQDIPGMMPARARFEGAEVEAEWRILTVHHLDGDKANCRWWNLVALCQTCHLSVQSRVVMERVYPHSHTPWFRPYVAAYYGWVYLGEDLTREETMARLDELLSLERQDHVRGATRQDGEQEDDGSQASPTASEGPARDDVQGVPEAPRAEGAPDLSPHARVAEGET